MDDVTCEIGWYGRYAIITGWLRHKQTACACEVQMTLRPTIELQPSRRSHIIDAVGVLCGAGSV